MEKPEGLRRRRQALRGSTRLSGGLTPRLAWQPPKPGRSTARRSAWSNLRSQSVPRGKARCTRTRVARLLKAYRGRRLSMWRSSRSRRLGFPKPSRRVRGFATSQTRRCRRPSSEREGLLPSESPAVVGAGATGRPAPQPACIGFTNPVLIGDGGEIIAGRGRVMGAKEPGLKSVPTVRLSPLSQRRGGPTCSPTTRWP